MKSEENKKESEKTEGDGKLEEKKGKPPLPQKAAWQEKNVETKSENAKSENAKPENTKSENAKPESPKLSDREKLKGKTIKEGECGEGIGNRMMKVESNQVK